MFKHIAYWAVCTAPLLAHCPSALQGPLANHLIKMQGGKANMQQMKIAGPSGGSGHKSQSDHDAPIIVQDGSVKIDTTYETKPSGMRHACPGQHQVDIYQWSREPMKQNKPAVITEAGTVGLNDSVVFEMSEYDRTTKKGWSQAVETITMKLIATSDGTDWQISPAPNASSQTTGLNKANAKPDDGNHEFVKPQTSLRLRSVIVKGKPYDLDQGCAAVQIWHPSYPQKVLANPCAIGRIDSPGRWQKSTAVPLYEK